MGRISNLPTDIMLDILTRLPAESVFVCKLVFKPWRALARLPFFSQMHLNHLNSDSGKLSFIIMNYEQVPPKFYYSEYQEDFHETPPISRLTRTELKLPFEAYSLAGSHNGLICFNSYSYDCFAPAYICNPVTKEYIILPRSRGTYGWTGFGHVPSTNEYKVIRVSKSQGGSNVGTVEVYTLGSGKGWRSAGKMNISYMGYHMKGVGVFLNGALHWADNGCTAIHAFHLADETFSQVPSPPSCLLGAAKPDSTNLGVLGDFLSATNYIIAGGSEIWLLKNSKDNCNGFIWSKEFSFNSPIQHPFGFTTSGRLLCSEYHKIHSYDQRASSDKVEVSFGRSISQVILHKNTFVSLEVFREKDTKTLKSGARGIPRVFPKHGYKLII